MRHALATRPSLTAVFLDHPVEGLELVHLRIPLGVDALHHGPFLGAVGFGSPVRPWAAMGQVSNNNFATEIKLAGAIGQPLSAIFKLLVERLRLAEGLFVTLRIVLKPRQINIIAPNIVGNLNIVAATNGRSFVHRKVFQYICRLGWTKAIVLCNPFISDRCIGVFLDFSPGIQTIPHLVSKRVVKEILTFWLKGNTTHQQASLGAPTLKQKEH